jgi:hypothetical protein
MNFNPQKALIGHILRRQTIPKDIRIDYFIGTELEIYKKILSGIKDPGIIASELEK